MGLKFCLPASGRTSAERFEISYFCISFRSFSFSPCRLPQMLSPLQWPRYESRTRAVRELHYRILASGVFFPSALSLSAITSPTDMAQKKQNPLRQKVICFEILNNISAAAFSRVRNACYGFLKQVCWPGKLNCSQPLSKEGRKSSRS